MNSALLHFLTISAPLNYAILLFALTVFRLLRRRSATTIRWPVPAL